MSSYVKSKVIDMEKIMGYYDPKEGDAYCGRHALKSMLPIMEFNEEYWGSRCAICGADINDSKWPESN
jgi:hypothetical protein